ncbi:MAG: type 4a pilus biogenesis protein PilO [Actinomycetota bacterium]|nr:type 4a pilus biogenesis protein PilO [Actinomycetota bacterium]
MEKLRQYVALTVVLVLAILAAGWFLLVSPERTKAAQINASAASRMAENAGLETQLRVLKQERDDLPKKQAELAAVAAKIPDSRSLPALIRALTTVTASAGVELLTITPGATTLTAPTAAVAAVPSAAGARPVVGRRVPSATAGQLGTIPVTLAVAGTYYNIERFLAGIEELPRAMRVTSLSLALGTGLVKAGTAPAANSGSLLANISAQVYTAVGRTSPSAVVLPGVPVAPGQVTPVVPSAPVYPTAAPTRAPRATPTVSPKK